MNKFKGVPNYMLLILIAFSALMVASCYGGYSILRQCAEDEERYEKFKNECNARKMIDTKVEVTYACGHIDTLDCKGDSLKVYITRDVPILYNVILDNVVAVNIKDYKILTR